MPKSTVSTKSLLAPRAASGASGLDRAGLRPALGPGATSIPPTTRGQSKINTANLLGKICPRIGSATRLQHAGPHKPKSLSMY